MDEVIKKSLKKSQRKLINSHTHTDVAVSAQPEQPSVTQLLSAWRAGDKSALEQLTPMVYAELHQLAKRSIRHECSSHTLQPTAVVHEAFMRMVGMDVPWQDRAHFYAIAATAMRRILVAHAKARRCAKCSSAQKPISLDDDTLTEVSAANDAFDVLEISEALERMFAQDPRITQVPELHYFSGLNITETTEALNISVATVVHRDMRLPKAWMLSQGGRAQE